MDPSSRKEVEILDIPSYKFKRDRDKKREKEKKRGRKGDGRMEVGRRKRTLVV